MDSMASQRETNTQDIKMYRASVAYRSNRLPPVAFDGVLRNAANFGVTNFERKKKF